METLRWLVVNTERSRAIKDLLSDYSDLKEIVCKNDRKQFELDLVIESEKCTLTLFLDEYFPSSQPG